MTAPRCSCGHTGAAPDPAGSFHRSRARRIPGCTAAGPPPPRRPGASVSGSSPPGSPDGCGPCRTPPAHRRIRGTGSCCGSAAAHRRGYPPLPHRSRPGGSGRPAPAGAWPPAPLPCPCDGSRSRRTAHSTGSPAPPGGARARIPAPPCRRRRFSAPSG